MPCMHIFHLDWSFGCEAASRRKITGISAYAYCVCLYIFISPRFLLSRFGQQITPWGITASELLKLAVLHMAFLIRMWPATSYNFNMWVFAVLDKLDSPKLRGEGFFYFCLKRRRTEQRSLIMFFFWNARIVLYVACRNNPGVYTP